MAELYTKQAKNALLLAGKSARQSNQNYIGTEHILMGLPEREGRHGGNGPWPNTGWRKSS